VNFEGVPSTNSGTEKDAVVEPVETTRNGACRNHRLKKHFANPNNCRIFADGIS